MLGEREREKEMSRWEIPPQCGRVGSPAYILGMSSKPNRQLTCGSVWFCPVSVVLNNDNRPEPPVDRSWI